LAAQGRVLNRHYAHYVCSPTRTSFQSGRLPVHVNTNNTVPSIPHSGMPRNMTGIAEKLTSAGYRSHFIGKWDVGMATPQHPPIGRGYNSSLHYFGHANDYWTEIANFDCKQNYVDLWETDKGASTVNGTAYEQDLFGNQIQKVLQNHDPKVPLFLVYGAHIVHAPLQVPQSYFDKFKSISDDDEAYCAEGYVIYPPDFKNFSCRRQVTAMINYLDDQIYNLTTLLQQKGMWENTLFVLTSDNGGNIDLTANAANNYPLRGGKYVSWEGGVRVNAFVSGGLIPTSVRGRPVDEMVHIADWYATFSGLAQVDPTDHRAAQWGLPPIDSLDIWPLISGTNNTSPRTEIPIDKGTFIQGNYKLYTENVGYAIWSSPIFPNKTSTPVAQNEVSRNCSALGGCLYDIVNDPSEYNDIAAANPTLLQNLKTRFSEVKKSYYANNETGVDSCPPNITQDCACYAAGNYYSGFWGPYQFLSLK